MTSRITSIEKTTNNVYLNVVIDHPEYKQNPSAGPLNYPTNYPSNEKPVDAYYNVTKNDSILDKCSDYYCSIIRFQLPLSELPLSICPIIPNQGQPNLTPMILGIMYGNPNDPLNKFPMNVIYIPKNTESVPIQNSTLQVKTPYYYIYSYQNFLEMFNTALTQSWNNSGLDALFPDYVPPYFKIDSNNSKLQLVTPACFVRLTAPATSIPLIYMNAAAQSYLDGFSVINFGYDRPQGDDTYFDLINQDYPHNYYYMPGVQIPAANPPANPPQAPYYYQFTQEYPVLQYWASLRKIIISTSAIPVRSEFIHLANNLITGGGNIGESNSQPIITDFIPNLTELAGSSRSIAYYAAPGHYRLVDLISDNALQNVSVQIYWQDRDGDVFPLPISIFQQCSLKFLFTRKSTYR